METATVIKKFKYEQISDYIIDAINKGTIISGSKIPSLRKMSEQFNCAVSVVMQAYQDLEIKGFVTAVEKSGFYAKASIMTEIPAPQSSRHSLISIKTKSNNMTGKMIEIAADRSILPLGCTIPDASILPIVKLQKIIIKKIKNTPDLLTSYTSPKGSLRLREQLAAMMFRRGINITADEIIITNGCTEALVLALKAATNEGDTIAVESPIFFGLITILEELKRRVIEVPTSPDTGIDLNILEEIFQKNDVKACMITSCFQNPLGFIMPLEHREKIVDLAYKNNISLVEDDIYGECSFYNENIRPCKSFDNHGQVIYCSSFSKLISPGMRTGWIIAGKHQNHCENIKVTETLGGSALLQETIADFLKNGGYTFHKRLFTKKIAEQTYMIRKLIKEHFPSDTKISNPDGGYFLWIESGKDLDSMKLFEAALEMNIGIIPGPIFSTAKKYRNCFRISCGSPVNADTEKGIYVLGEIIKKLRNKS